jgi:molybdopterin converting factor subunit 1
MNVRVKLFAAAKELAGSDELTVELPANATVAEVRSAVVESHPALDRIMRHAMWAVDAEYASDATIVTERSAVALIPPVSGG